MTHLRLIDAMKKTDFYPHHPAEVEFIQTHISYVFIAGNFVYKVKKHLQFDFLDFTTLKKRKFYCEEELRLNKRLASDTYLDVVAISEDAQGNLTLGEEIKIIDYAVRMKKLPADRMLKTLLFRGLADENIIDKVAGKIASFHQEARTGSHIDEMGKITNIRHNHEENFAEVLKYINVTIPEYQYKFIQEYVNKFLAEKETLFEKRVADHKIRDCHGDLHLDHICINSEITIFDCIEFNERFRLGDVAQDVAFLTMDIDFNGYPLHAENFVQSYIRYSGDTDMLTLLNFYRCYYAYVRGKVTSFRLSQREISHNERLEIMKTAKRYFDLAYAYATRLDKPVLILTTGLMGSGKSNQAKIIAERLGAELICTDVLRKETFEIKSAERRYEDFGQGIYSAEISRMIYQKVFDMAQEKLKRGKAVIIDGSFKKHEERQRAMELAKGLGIRFYILYCVCPDEITKKRLERRVMENDNASDGRWELFQKQRDDFDMIEMIPANHIFTMDTSDNPEMMREKIIRKIKLDE